MKSYSILAACAATALLSACASTNIETIAEISAKPSEATSAAATETTMIAAPIAETQVAETPTQPTETLLYAAMSKWEMMSFVDAVRDAGLSDLLEGQQTVTIFAPTNEAFERAGATEIDMAALLKNHMIDGSLSSQDLTGLIPDGATSTKIETMGGQSLTLYKMSGALRVAGSDGLLAKIVTADTDAVNGVLHQVNSVLSSE